MRDFKKYEVWQNSMVLINQIYDVCKEFPSSEKFGLKSQLQRAAVSIACNISEGAAKSSKKDFKRILEISLGSSYELETLLLVSKMRKFMTYETHNDLEVNLKSIQRQLNGLINSLR